MTLPRIVPPALAVPFQRALARDGHVQKMQALPAAQQASYLRGVAQVFVALRRQHEQAA